MYRQSPIPVIDLFSGPGGLGEGFSSFNDGKTYRIVVSAEMDKAAHETLKLRAYFRKVRSNPTFAAAYYDFCTGRTHLPWNDQTRELWEEAGKEAMCLTLGEPKSNADLDNAISERIPSDSECILIGGPPCQAYSLVGRARNKGKTDYRAEEDHRHFLYKEYLRVIERTRPAVFVMENVKGILSSKVGESRIFHEILKDLSDPTKAISTANNTNGSRYRIHSLTTSTVFEAGMDPDSIAVNDFIIRCEEFGIPQARHRVILVGVREDIAKQSPLLEKKREVFVREAISDLPPLRSKISRRKDDSEQWITVVSRNILELAEECRAAGKHEIGKCLLLAASKLKPELTTGGLRQPLADQQSDSISDLVKTLSDPALQVVLNHEARGHMESDLRRYAYSAAHTAIIGTSPKGHSQFNLSGLKPNHANWESGKFTDRFRTQAWLRPSTTITSHISKDGHYFIHPEVSQCRSLTVREAARLQTFPDNYFFQGNRTQQFHQVGNAVPPLLALQIARVVQNIVTPAIPHF
jgi:DNA (cytosine-5)-methyltransferase 1